MLPESRTAGRGLPRNYAGPCVITEVVLSKGPGGLAGTYAVAAISQCEIRDHTGPDNAGLGRVKEGWLDQAGPG